MKKTRSKNNAIDFSNIKSLTDGKANMMALLLEHAFDGVDLQNRIIKITGEIEEGYFHYVDAALNIMEEMNGKLITIRINSEGGLSSEALAIVGRLRQSKCTIVTEGYGQIMSAATLILAAGDKGKRRMCKYSTFMYHQASYGIGGKHLDNKTEIEQAEVEERRWAEWMSEFSDRDAEYWYKTGEVKNSYLLPEECLKIGIIDEIF